MGLRAAEGDVNHRVGRGFSQRKEEKASTETAGGLQAIGSLVDAS